MFEVGQGPFAPEEEAPFLFDEPPAPFDNPPIAHGQPNDAPEDHAAAVKRKSSLKRRHLALDNVMEVRRSPKCTHMVVTNLVVYTPTTAGCWDGASSTACHQRHPHGARHAACQRGTFHGTCCRCPGACRHALWQRHGRGGRTVASLPSTRACRPKAGDGPVWELLPCPGRPLRRRRPARCAKYPKQTSNQMYKMSVSTTGCIQPPQPPRLPSDAKPAAAKMLQRSTLRRCRPPPQPMRTFHPSTTRPCLTMHLRFPTMQWHTTHRSRPQSADQ